MTALITGASSGIGMEIARLLAGCGIKVIITGRNTEQLNILRDEIGAKKCKVFTADLANKNECFALYEKVKKYDIDILINNAGFGLFGCFSDTDLNKELEMINVNCSALHILTKLFLRDFTAKDKGYILNVASSAGFMPGPMMSTYYATKNYAVTLTEAIHEELSVSGSNVYIGAFCPGPVYTDFNSRAGVKSSSTKGISADYAAKYAIYHMFKRKMIIIPTLHMKLAVYGSGLVPDGIMLKFVSYFQSKKSV